MMTTNPKGYNRKYYKKNRKEIIKKLGEKCSVCGSEERLEIHHEEETELTKKKPYARGCFERLTDWRKNFKKLKLLCKKCHRNIHRDSNGKDKIQNK